MTRFLILTVISLPLAAQTTEQALDRYIEESLEVRQLNAPSEGSLYTGASYLTDLARDPRAASVGDLVTVLVAERASALTSGATSQARSSDSDSSIGRLLGQMGPLRPLPNLFNQASDSSLQGQASTSRQTNVTATITAYVSRVMPNGNLIIEGSKEVSVNSERQLVWIRGVVRQADLRPDNSVGSERIALLDLRVNGKGVVNSAIRRPNPIYRFFKALLPF